MRSTNPSTQELPWRFTVANGGHFNGVPNLAASSAASGVR
jgi:hypothetical protein